MAVSNPTPQRELRGQRPQRPSPRVVNSAEHQAWLAGHLTPRDRWLVRMLYEHKVFTTHQIVDLAFPSQRAASLRLMSLYRWGVVHRFQPHRDRGSHPLHYVLDTAGAALLAHEHGIDPHDLNYRRDREIGRAYSLQLAHTVGCNSVFTTLVRQTRQRGVGELISWWSAARCAHHWGDIVRPDGYGRWREAGRDVEWFIEWDFGTERLPRLGFKLAGYERLAEHTGIITPVLIWLPSTRREAGARRILADALRSLDHRERVPVATTATDLVRPEQALDANAARWLPLQGKATEGRLRLADLSTRWPRSSTGTPDTTTSARDSIDLPDRAEMPPPTPTPPPLPAYRRRR
ncbi:replication-relaxation family protein [Prauserella oleivorans]|uniref:Replication-relaxation family protein n=1 Tax=Prauserella oleivorans TaxID=1478153 RepID=A0ABW5WFT9_9PSEU